MQLATNGLRSSPIGHSNGQTPREKDAKRFDWLDAETLLSTNFKTEFLVRDVLTADQPAVVAGPSKCCKTSILCDLAISLATGADFLGNFPVDKTGRVLFACGEGGYPRLSDILRRQLAARELGPSDLGDRLQMTRSLPQINNPADLHCLRPDIETHQPVAVIVDPLYLALSADGKETSMFHMGSAMKPFFDLCASYSAISIFAHHANKAGSKIGHKPNLDDMAFAGMTQFFGQWLLINKRLNYDELNGEHNLFLRIGGRTVDSSTWRVCIREGLRSDQSGQVWEVKLSPDLMPTDEKIPQNEDLKIDDTLTKIGDFLSTQSPDALLTKKDIKEQAGMSGRYYSQAWDKGVKEGLIVMAEEKVKRANGRKYDAWKWSPKLNNKSTEDTKDTGGTSVSCPP